MKRTLKTAALLCALVLGAFDAHAQQVYRCGRSYSQVPCPGGVAIDTKDARSKKQTQESQKVIQRDKQLAKEMEETRKRDDAMALAGSTPAAPKPEKSKPNKTKPRKPLSNEEAQAKAKKKKEAALFTAADPAGKKKEKKVTSPTAP